MWVLQLSSSCVQWHHQEQDPSFTPGELPGDGGVAWSSWVFCGQWALPSFDCETGTVDTKKGYRGLNGAAPVTSSRPEPLLGWCTAPSTDRLCLLQVLHAVSWASCSDPSDCSPVALVASFEHSAYQVDLGVCIYDPVLNLVSHNFRISSVLVEIWMWPLNFLCSVDSQPSLLHKSELKSRKLSYCMLMLTAYLRRYPAKDCRASFQAKLNKQLSSSEKAQNKQKIIPSLEYN